MSFAISERFRRAVNVFKQENIPRETRIIRSFNKTTWKIRKVEMNQLLYTVHQFVNHWLDSGRRAYAQADAPDYRKFKQSLLVTEKPGS